MPPFQVIKGQRGIVKAWTNGVPVEDAAIEQLKRTADMPFIYKHVAAMPDVHLGKGATIGSVIATTDAVMPAAVGVDIGCGMMAARTTLKAEMLPSDLGELRAAIEEAVPHGRTDNGGENDSGAWPMEWEPESVLSAWSVLHERFWQLVETYKEFQYANALRHLGTLGTGNHFIEVCTDETGSVWVVVHSGSRGIGGKIGSYFIRKAKEGVKRWHIKLDDPDLAYLPQGTQLFDDYLDAANWAQAFARTNRELMMAAVLRVLERHTETLAAERIDCHHNYVAKEHHFGKNVWVTRKGACRAREGDMVIIPGSMGAKSYIARGKGCRASFNSCSHGAGRAMSRTEAKRRFTPEDHKRETAGVECRKDADVLDETPQAYKSIDAVMAAQTDLVEIVHTLKQVVCVKG